MTSIGGQAISVGRLSRLALLAGVLCITALVGLAPAARADEGPVEFLRRVSRELIAANGASNAQAFAEALNKNAHVRAIGTYALGSYQPSLRPADRDPYFSGMVRFISRYAANESQKYKVVRADILGPAQQTSSGVVIDTRVVLRDGQSYDVQWLLQKTGGAWKVRDAKVQVLLGEYWMTPFLKDLFEKYIADNGSVAALVVALNR